MGLFRKKKKNNDSPVDYSVSFENLNDGDDAFLVSAISNSPNSDYFETPDEVLEKTRGYGASSGLAYYNKYSSTNQKLASSDVVDIGAIKKPAPAVAKVEEKPQEDDNENFLEEGDILLKPVDMNDDKEDKDFDSFFEDFMKKSKKEQPEQKEEKKEEVTPKVEVKPQVKKNPVKRKKKRAIDIDIISGTVGGDII